MKKYAIMIAILIIGLGMAKPHDTDPCAEKRSLYVQYYKAGMYEDSRNFWLDALDICGGVKNMDFKFFDNGRSIYLQLRKKIEEDELAYQANSDSICWIYESGLQLEHDKDWPLDYAVFLIANKYDETEKIDSLFSGHENDLELNNPNYIHFYFQHLILNHYNKTPLEEKDGVIKKITEKYFKLYRKCLIGEQTSPVFNDTKDFLDKYFLMIQTGDMLLKSLETEFENLNENEKFRLVEIKHSINLMDKKDVEKGDVYSIYIEEMLRLDPNPAGYFGLGKIALEEGQYEKAKKSFEKAMELDQDADDIYLYYMSLTLYDEGYYERAFGKAKSVEGEYKGKALIICANCIAAKANDCGETTVMRRANYWLANDYIRLAYQLGEEVNPNKYLDKAPDREICFKDEIYDGDKINCKCWNESTKARFLEE